MISGGINISDIVKHPLLDFDTRDTPYNSTNTTIHASKYTMRASSSTSWA